MMPTSQSEVLARLWAAADDDSSRAALQRVVYHPSGHRPLPPGKDAVSIVDVVRAFLLEQRTQCCTPAEEAHIAVV